jgi:predicted HicB family RNase H-like nuclease
MKRIVNGVTYNTDTATRLAQSLWTEIFWGSEPADLVQGVLYQTRGGAFFDVKEITRTEWDERERSEVAKTFHEFEPLSPEKANAWLLRANVEVFHNPFEDPPEATTEAEPGSSILIRVPASLKQRVDEAAKNAGLSVNVWAMRCLEGCLSQRKDK